MTLVLRDPFRQFTQMQEQLRRADFLYEWSFRGLEFSSVFKHALLQEVAYQRLAAREQRALHARVLDAIEQLVQRR